MGTDITGQVKNVFSGMFDVAKANPVGALAVGFVIYLLVRK